MSGAGDYVGTIPLGHYRECPFHTNDTEPELFDEPFPTDQSVRVAAGILVVYAPGLAVPLTAPNRPEREENGGWVEGRSC